MPRYAERYTDLAERGADVRLSVARPVGVRASNAKTDSLADIRGIIDTGADICVIRQALADDLGLQQHDERNFGNSSGAERRPVYMADLIFKDEKRRPYEVAGCEFHGQSIEFLLGRNFLAHAKLAYDGTTGHYELNFD